jgi:hypothetical protein
VTLVLVAILGNRWAFEVSHFALAHAPRTVEWVQVLPELRRTRPQPYVLYIGNSQVTLVRDARPEDRSSYEWLAQMLPQRSGSVDNLAVYPGSLGGMTVTEALFTLHAYLRSAGRPTLVLLALSHDLFRMVGARPEVVAAVRDAGLQQELILAAETADLPQAAAALRFSLAQVVPEQAVVTRNSPMQKVEQELQSFAESLPVFAARQGMQGTFLATFTRWRNRAFGIRSSSRRAVPPEIYRANLEMVEVLLSYASAHNLRLLLYLSPSRPLQPGPYSPADLRRFREDVSALVRRYPGVVCLDYLDLLPEGYWTNYPEGTPDGLDGQPDFAHMTGRGHFLLAQFLAKEVSRDLAASKADTVQP